jgi:tRNA(Met) C34 N-acetyltransferase TmcA
MTTAINNSMLDQVQNAIEAKAREAMEYGATEYAHDIASARKDEAKKRKVDLNTGAKNEQSNLGAKKSRATTAKLKDSVQTSAMLQLPVSRADDSMTGDELCALILDTHAKLQAGQIDQLTGYANQGSALTIIKRQLLTEKQLDESDEKKVNRAFGQKLKDAGIGDDVIARQARSMYIWLSENIAQAQKFVSDALATEKEQRTKEQKKVVNAHARIGLTPYVIMSAMTESAPTAEKTALDTAKAHIKQVIKDLGKRKGKNKFDFDSADADAKIIELAKSLIDQALAEINV